MEEVPIHYTEEWTADQIKVANITLQKAKAFNWLHNESYRYYSSWGRVTNFVVSTFVSVTSSVGIIITFIDIPPVTAKILQAVFYGLFIVASVVGIALGIWNPDNKAAEHYNYAMRSKELYANLSTDMVEIITHTQIHQMLIDTLKMELHMRDDAPVVPGHVWKKYYRYHGNKAIKTDVLLSRDEILIQPTTSRSAHVLPERQMVTLEDSYSGVKQLYDRCLQGEDSDVNTDAEIEKAIQYVDRESAKPKIRSSAMIERKGKKLSAKDEFELARFNSN